MVQESQNNKISLQKHLEKNLIIIGLEIYKIALNMKLRINVDL